MNKTEVRVKVFNYSKIILLAVIIYCDLTRGVFSNVLFTGLQDGYVGFCMFSGISR